jgi:hypothetical protein
MYLIAEDSRTCYTRELLWFRKREGQAVCPTLICCWESHCGAGQPIIVSGINLRLLSMVGSQFKQKCRCLYHWKSHISSAFCFFLSGVASTLLYNFLQQRLLSCSDIFHLARSVRLLTGVAVRDYLARLCQTASFGDDSGLSVCPGDPEQLAKAGAGRRYRISTSKSSHPTIT